MSLPTAATKDFIALLEYYRRAKITFPVLKAISFAQWAVECGYGSSRLARDHHNYGGAKWRPYMNAWASAVSYTAHDGATLYCKFADHEQWVNGYWDRFDKEPAYKGWRNHTKSGESFLAFIGPIWLGMGDEKGAEYVAKVTRVHDQMDLALAFRMEPTDELSNLTLADLRRIFPDRGV